MQVAAWSPVRYRNSNFRLLVANWISHPRLAETASSYSKSTIGRRLRTRAIPAWVEEEFRRYLTCGILAHGFARARCPACGHDFLVAFSCKGRGVCPSCNTRRMVETAAHLVDHVFLQVPVRQWGLAFPKRLRHFLHRDPGLAGRVLTLALRGIETRLRECSPGAPAGARFGAATFIQRFGPALNAHLHFHICAISIPPVSSSHFISVNVESGARQTPAQPARLVIGQSASAI